MSDKPAPRLIDTHAHLEMDRYDGDREAVIARSLDALEAVITIGIDESSCQAACALAEAHERIFFTVGIHPHNASAYDDALEARLREWASHPRCVGVGECGLDYHYDRSPRDVQREAMRRQISLAMELVLPAIIHSREAGRDTMDILRASGIERGVMHCFSGDTSMAHEVLALGLHISIAGPVTFNNSAPLREVAAMVPDDRLLLETDAPFLTPAPHRGRRNEPAYVEHTARVVAALRGITLEDVARITSLNARRLFGLPGAGGEGELAYRIRDSLYLNLTNRCTNACTFCTRRESYYVKGHNLELRHEAGPGAYMAEIGDPAQYEEIVFCGYGEPTIRLDVIREVGRWVKGHGGRVRLNTNGQAAIIHGRDVLPELRGAVDTISVSLNAPDAESYDRLCHPGDAGAYDAMLSFIRGARAMGFDVVATAVDAPGVDIEGCERAARELGVPLRVRAYNRLG